MLVWFLLSLNKSMWGGHWDFATSLFVCSFDRCGYCDSGLDTSPRSVKAEYT
ncbi:hypothetical protein KC19_8G035400 [Ceratodon purpureus]|uniref:Uncharacterized protein n=1 Tax=Ceratodon purpureus TaxID=3225 RepID=A0A8T0GZ56_CERPU|nr:hypothetical protein KC19_8G035400 [Ceratodon purpureus]